MGVLALAVRKVQRRSGLAMRYPGRPRKDRIGKSMLRTPDSVTLLRTAIQLGQPFCVSRFGSTELAALEHCIQVPESSWVSMPRRISSTMSTLSGFFPPTRQSIYAFANLYAQIGDEFDAVAYRTKPGSWITFAQESLVQKNLCPQAVSLSIEIFNDPFPSSHRWFTALEGKRVLVV